MATNSHLHATSRPPPERSMEGHALQAELTAMQQIAVALSQLDEPTRARVLHWAAERFPSDAAAVVVTPPAPLYAVTRLRPRPEPVKAADESLSVSALDEFFDPSESKALKAAKAPTEPNEPETAQAPDQSVTGMLHDFVVEFQDIARDWNVACSGPTEERDVEPVLSVVS